MADSCDAHVRRQKAGLCSLNYDQLIMKLNFKDLPALFYYKYASLLLKREF